MDIKEFASNVKVLDFELEIEVIGYREYLSEVLALLFEVELVGALNA